jgi:hypothetical protein
MFGFRNKMEGSKRRESPCFNSAVKSVFSVATGTGLPDSFPSQALSSSGVVSTEPQPLTGWSQIAVSRFRRYRKNVFRRAARMLPLISNPIRLRLFQGIRNRVPDEATPISEPAKNNSTRQGCATETESAWPDAAITALRGITIKERNSSADHRHRHRR